jgi:threonine dehydrogenase-like Zn-dependent dehydrogenase
VPNGISDDAAILVDSIASAAHAVLRRPPREGETLLINGAGIIGLGLAASIRALRHDNAVVILARHRFQAELAARLGATHVLTVPRKTKARDRYAAVARLCRGKPLPGRFGSADLLGGFDLVYDCSGTGTGLTDAIKWTRSRGTVVLVGTSGITLLDTTSVWFNELQILGTNGRQLETATDGLMHTYDLVFRWMADGRIDLPCLLVRRYRLADYRTAFRDLLCPGRRGILKAAFEP